MRVAAIYDIHGNLPALEAVLAELRQVAPDEVLVGGDVFPGPQADECLDRLLDFDIPARFIRGNGDREVLTLAAGGSADGVPEPYREAMRWVAQRLDARQRRIMEAWPETLRIEIEGLGDVLFCHATPRSDAEVFTRDTDAERLVDVFAGAGASLVVCGHTHMQFDRRIGDVRVVNAGSVGMPFGDPGAYWLLLGAGVELRHTRYDLAAAAQRIMATDYPQADDFAANNVVHPPTQQEMLRLFGG